MTGWRFRAAGANSLRAALRSFTLQPRCAATSRKAATSPTIWADAVDRDRAENPGIRVAQVTAGTRCYCSSRQTRRSSSVQDTRHHSMARTARVVPGTGSTAALYVPRDALKQPPTKLQLFAVQRPVRKAVPFTLDLAPRKAVRILASYHLPNQGPRGPPSQAQWLDSRSAHDWLVRSCLLEDDSGMMNIDKGLPANNLWVFVTLRYFDPIVLKIYVTKPVPIKKIYEKEQDAFRAQPTDGIVPVPAACAWPRDHHGERFNYRL